MAVASAEDVAVALGRPLTSAEEEQADWWLTGAEIAVRSRLGDPALLDQDVLLYVEAEVVAGKIRRAGREESSVTVSVDDGSVTRRYDSVGTNDIGDDLWGLLSPARSSSAFTIGVKSPLDVP